MGRKVLLITTDQQRYDALGCNGGAIAQTPNLDRLAATGVNYRRAHNQNVVCMPARATIFTGQLVRTHGVISNGIPLPMDAVNPAALLKEAGYRTALIGKAHFEPASDPAQSFYENWAAKRGVTGPHRGFDRMELAGHTGRAGRSLFHYPKWLADNHPAQVEQYYQTVDEEKRVNGAGGGDTDAPQVSTHNRIPREIYHTDWVADQAIKWLDSLCDLDDWFLWLSFPDPHHPWDPPASEVPRVNWRDLDLPQGFPGSRERAIEILGDKPRHWLEWYLGSNQFAFEVPPTFRPCDLSPDQVREINALTHVENELIDEACGRVLSNIVKRGWDPDTDILYTTDHGEMQGDFGMLFKGPYHVDALMRVPMIWRPAPSANIKATEVTAPVGHLDIAPTICQLAGLAVPDEMDGTPLPTSADNDRERVITEWDGDFGGHGLHLRSLYRDRYTCTVYEPSNYYDGTEGELYDLVNDPLQWRNLWDDPSARAIRDELVADLRDHLPAPRDPPLERVALV